MPTEAQSLRALQCAQEVRLGRARQRAALRRAPTSVIAAALINPTAELASYRLRDLFGSRTMVYQFGPRRLLTALRKMEQEHPRGRHWNVELRLRDLTRGERQRLAKAITEWAA